MTPAYFYRYCSSELGRHSGPDVCEILTYWVKLPAVDAFAPQEAMEVFVVAHELLARLRCDLPVSQDATVAGAALAVQSCGTLLYWINRSDLPESDRRVACRSAWTELDRHEKGVALTAIRECALLGLRPRRIEDGEAGLGSIHHFFPGETAEVCRHALRRPDIQAGYFRHFFDSDRKHGLLFALRVLQACGTRSDLALLRQLSEHSSLGREAVKAIRCIEARLVTH